MSISDNFSYFQHLFTFCLDFKIPVSGAGTVPWQIKQLLCSAGIPFGHKFMSQLLYIPSSSLLLLFLGKATRNGLSGWALATPWETWRHFWLLACGHVYSGSNDTDHHYTCSQKQSQRVFCFTLASLFSFVVGFLFNWGFCHCCFCILLLGG